VKSTGKFLVALDHAKVATFWVRTLPYRAAHVFAAMSLALFKLVADSLALQVVNFMYFFTSHKLFTDLIRIVDHVAGVLCLGLVADAALIDHLFAAHALIIMTLFDALVPSTG
jgi:hypothetical protein